MYHPIKRMKILMTLL